MTVTFANNTLSFTAGENAGADIQTRASSQTLRLEGAATVATLTTGVNTGTAGTGTTSTSIVKPTAAANWTSTNLVGKWFKRTGGGGYVANGDNLRPILSNLTTTLAINTMTGCDNTTTFDIIDPASLMDQVSADVLVGIRVQNCLGPVEIVGFDFSTAHSLDSLMYISDCPDVLIRGCNFGINTANPSLYILRCGRVRVEHCRLASSADISISDGCKNVAVTGVVNAGGGVVEVSDFFKADITKLSAASAPSRVLSLIRGVIANVEAACSSGSATPVYMEAVDHMAVTGNGLTGTGNTGYGLEIADKGGHYDLVGSTITGSLGDLYMSTAAAAGRSNLRWGTELGSSFGAVATATSRVVAQTVPTMTMWFGPTIFMQDLQFNAGVLEYGFVHPAQLTGITATGTTYADAYEIPQQRFVRVDTTPSGTGVRASPAAAIALPGYEFTISNKGANALLVYPPAGGTIDGAGTNVGYSIAAGAKKSFVVISDNCLTLESF